MKIKEVAARTGLTEKAIRFYESKRLITPQTYELNGRIFREYTEENIRDLQRITVLRRAFFSVGQIQEILCDNSRTPEIFREYRETLCSDYAVMTPLVERVQQANPDMLTDLRSVAEMLTEDPVASESRPQPRELRISRSDDTADSEREEAYRTFLRRQRWRDWRDSTLTVLGRCMRFLGIVAAAAAGIFLVVFVLSNIRIIRPVSVTLEAIEWKEDDPAYVIPRTITLRGESEHYLFRSDIVELRMEISGYGTQMPYELHLPMLRLSRSSIHPGEGWHGWVFDSIYDQAAGESVLVDNFYTNGEAGFGYFLICEQVSSGSYTYDPTGNSRILTFGVEDREQAQLLYQYSKLEDRKTTEKRLRDLYGE